MSRRARWASVLILAASSTACFGYTKRSVPAPTPVPTRAGTVRVTLANGVQWELKNAQVQGDSIVGLAQEARGERKAFAIAQITSVESRGFRPLRTIGAIIGFPLAIFAYALALSLGG